MLRTSGSLLECSDGVTCQMSHDLHLEFMNGRAQKVPVTRYHFAAVLCRPAGGGEAEKAVGLLPAPFPVHPPLYTREFLGGGLPFYTNLR